jgi:hypothetical protein
MMKLACFGETWAPPRRKPFRPAASINRAAWSPGGLVNTEPQLGSPIGCVALRFTSSSRMEAWVVGRPPGNSSSAARNHSPAGPRTLR